MKHLPAIVSGILCAAVAAALVHECEGRKRAAEVDGYLAELATVHEQIATAHTRSTTLREALDDAGDENRKLAALVASLRKQSRDVREVVRWRTRVEAADPVVVVEAANLPAEHLHALDNGLTVARFGYDGDHATFETFDQEWRASAVVGASSSSMLLEGRTSFSEAWTEVPLESFTVARIEDAKPHRILRPRVGVGVYVGAPRPEVTARVTMDWLYPHPNVALLGINAGGNEGVFRGGIDAVSYNVGGPLPVIDDLWLRVGASLGTSGWPDAAWAIDVGVGTRF